MQSMQIITPWQCISLEMNVKVFKKCCISNTMDGTDDGVLWNGGQEDGNVRSVKKMKALTVKMGDG